MVETYIDARDVPRPAMIYYPRGELAHDNSNWWGPNQLCVQEMLGTCGFKRVEPMEHPVNRDRLQVAALMGAEASLQSSVLSGLSQQILM